MNHLLFLDTECTGIDAEDRLLQVAFRYNDGTTNMTVNELFKPPVRIKYGAMAIHHVTEKMVAGKPRFIGSKTQMALRTLSESAVLVAHNAKYDLGMLAKEDVTFARHICTYKVAKALDTDGRFENHQLQTLRYTYGIEIEAVAHDALGDIDVLEAVFGSLLEDSKAKLGTTDESAAIDWMIDLSANPVLFDRFNFGKHDYKKTGMTIHDICTKLPYQEGKGYLMWLLAQKMQKPEGEEDWIYTLNYYLKNT